MPANHRSNRPKTQSRLDSRPYGIQGQIFPFRPREPKEQFPGDPAFIQAEINAVLIGIDDMIWQQARSWQRTCGISEEDTEDVTQSVRMNLWQRGLVNFSTAYDVKLTTYIHACIHNYVKQAVRDIKRRQDRSPEASSSPELAADELLSVDTEWDDKVYEIADDVIVNPEKYLTPKQAVVFRLLMDNPNALIQDLAGVMSYSQASSLSMMKRRIKDRLKEISIPDGKKA
jgi:DNA-directed RNA polymerase specialized sigma24 family protein